MKKTVLRILLIGAVLAVLVTAAFAQEAENLSSALLLEGDAFGDTAFLKNGYDYDYKNAAENGKLTVASEEEISSLYLFFVTPPEAYSLEDSSSGEKVLCDNGFIHAFLDLEELFGHPCKELVISFEKGGQSLGELTAYSAGELPASVQNWEEPMDGETDLVLFSTHGDDDQIFFAGLLPYYAGELGYQVQVCYFTGHQNNNINRMHEMLNGLWAVGVRTYPVFGPFPDFRVDDLAACYTALAGNGYSREDVISYVTEQLRRFKPQVAVGHDLNGEYGHGQHKIYADCLAEAVEIAQDPAVYPESAEQYGVWDTPKTYLHLYGENAIVMDWDQPLEHFGGKTAFEVTQKLGLPCHESQMGTYYPQWLKSVSRCDQLLDYSPCEYGLFRSTVGPDREKKDMFENVLTYAEQAEKAAEEEAARQAEEARLAEEARKAEERAKAEEAAAAAEKAKEQERQELAEEVYSESYENPEKVGPVYVVVGVVFAVAFLLLILALVMSLRKRGRR